MTPELLVKDLVMNSRLVTPEMFVRDLVKHSCLVTPQLFVKDLVHSFLVTPELLVRDLLVKHDCLWMPMAFHLLLLTVLALVDFAVKVHEQNCAACSIGVVHLENIFF